MRIKKVHETWFTEEKIIFTVNSFGFLRIAEFMQVLARNSKSRGKDFPLNVKVVLVV